MNNNPTPLRTGLRGAAIGVTAVAVSVFGLAAAAGASDSVDTQPVEAQTSVEVPADAETVELTEADLAEFDLGDVPEGEWFVAEMVDAGEIPADAEIIELTEADLAEFDLGDVPEGEWFEAEMVDADEIPADAEIVNVDELADVEEYTID